VKLRKTVQWKLRSNCRITRVQWKEVIVYSIQSRHHTSFNISFTDLDEFGPGFGSKSKFLAVGQIFRYSYLNNLINIFRDTNEKDYNFEDDPLKLYAV
jgi:hypothetical protein